MTESSDQQDKPITKEEISDFARKLEQWCELLPPEERTLGDLLIARARSIQPIDVVVGAEQDDLADRIESVLEGQLGDEGSIVWVKGPGPIWLRRPNEPRPVKEERVMDEEEVEAVVELTIQVAKEAD